MNWLRSFVTVNWELKATAVTLAFVLWLAVHGDQSGERFIAVPLEIRNTPRHLVITNDHPTSVELTIRGTVTTVWLGAAIPTCVVDLQGTEEGERIIPLTPADVRVPRGTGLEVLSVRPPRIRLVLERTTTKTVAVRVAVEGKAAEGYEIYSMSANPQSVILTGPHSHLLPISQVGTETIPVQGQRESVRASVHLNIQDTMVQTSQVRPVEVNIEIGEVRKLRTVTHVPVVSAEPGVTVDPARVAVQILMPQSFKGSLSPSDFNATVSARELDASASEGRVKPEVHPASALGPGVLIKEVIPPLVTVRRTGKK
jgi:YbbR domain-containing protein